jgi:hypothetical protein
MIVSHFVAAHNQPDDASRECRVTLEYDDATLLATRVRCVNNTDHAVRVEAAKVDASGEPVPGEVYFKVFAADAEDTAEFPQSGAKRIFLSFSGPGKLEGYLVRTQYPYAA